MTMAVGTILLILGFSFGCPGRYRIEVNPQNPYVYTKIDTWTGKVWVCDKTNKVIASQLEQIANTLPGAKPQHSASDTPDDCH
jgi:hypothetical protein